MNRRNLASVAALAAASALVLSGCGQAPESDSGDAGGDNADYCARMVTNSGGLEDRSFNQSSWEGLEQAQDEYGIDAQAIVSKTPSDLEPNVEQAVDTGCRLIVTVGWELAEYTQTAAADNPDRHFAIVDEQLEGENITSVVFNTAEAAFLAGYLAAGATQSGTVGTFGGGNQPPVTLFMDGYVDGVAHYNEVHDADVTVIGWDKDAQDGQFTGDFEDVNKGKATAESLIQQGADVIMPVAGQVGEGAAAAAADAGDVSIIWVDNDGYETLPEEYRPLILTSVLKKTQDAVTDIVKRDLDGELDNTPFIGTLENGGVDIAPFHDMADAVSDDLAAEIDELRQQIIDGEVEVSSPSSPTA
ncbi:BMP family protein [Microbacterium sp. MPKO10]|uniref:BMP family lipoprotein n=1 Tax=Microbacterium sp. MPKO10 TaxID=2989818 RepID=UPI00223666A7|nr:BMP family ABC transporter substrate-binding protein [Microbacterium sp. MPKO10]MCW4457760.1 BMP family ABC transporter substrate-binding protein [Microbacterium sp. MPKO10]